MNNETQKMELRSKLKSMERRRSRIACRVADNLEIDRDFMLDELDLDDPRVSDSDKEQIITLNEKIYTATWELEKLENPTTWKAKQSVFDLLNMLSLEESILLLRKAGCLTSFDLVEKVARKPEFLEEVVS